MNKILTLFILFNLFFIVEVIGQGNQTVSSGSATNAVNFDANCSYTWVNNNSAIGLPASGTGNIASFIAQNTSTTPITATITATPASGGFAYVSNTNSGTVSVISVAENRVVATIPVLGSPVGIALTADGKRAFVGNSGSGRVSVINTENNTVIDEIPLIDYSVSICVNKDGSRLYVANYNAGTISVINTATKAIITNIPAGQGPYNICISPDDTRLYVTNNNFRHSNPTTVTVINAVTNTAITPITVGAQPEGLTISKDGSRVYVANAASNTVSVINTASNTVVETIPVDNGPHGVVLSADDKTLYTRVGLTAKLLVTDLATKVTTRVALSGNGSMSLGISADGAFVYIPNHFNNHVSVVNTVTNTEVAVIPVQSSPNASGNFVSAGIGCQPVTFTITVNPPPVVTIGPVTGTINTCVNTASTSTQQFDISGSNLTGNINVAATGSFGVSTLPGGPFLRSINLSPVNGIVAPITLYVNVSGSRVSGPITNDIIITTPGMADKKAVVNAFIDVNPIINPMSDFKFKGGDIVGPITFSGTADKYRWLNSEPGIGLPASGTGSLTFTATNNGTQPLVANITAVPVNNTNCEGVPTYFTITVENDPEITAGAATGTIAGCLGTPSNSTQQFPLSGRHLKAVVRVKAPPGFQVSTSSNSGFADSVRLMPLNGAVAGTIIYVRSSITGRVGVNTGNVTILTTGASDQSVGVSSTVNTTPVVGAIPNQTVATKNTTRAITFTGTADQYQWTNNNPAIGLAASGTGDITSFTAINNSNTDVTATITVVPVNSSGCQGNAVSFSITVEAERGPVVIIPNVITPNGDGINDTWVIKNLNSYPKAVVKVFNRLGSVVFLSQGYPQPWNGRTGNKDLPIGTYYYLIDTSEDKVFSGYLSIMR